jgi:hypothetical protein
MTANMSPDSRPSSNPGAAGHPRVSSPELGRRLPMACAAHFLGPIRKNTRTTG